MKERHILPWQIIWLSSLWKNMFFIFLFWGMFRLPKNKWFLPLFTGKGHIIFFIPITIYLESRGNHSCIKWVLFISVMIGIPSRSSSFRPLPSYLLPSVSNARKVSEVEVMAHLSYQSELLTATHTTGSRGNMPCTRTHTQVKKHTDRKIQPSIFAQLRNAAHTVRTNRPESPSWSKQTTLVCPFST